jgi:hypothetical protein
VKRILQGDGAKLILGLAFVFTVISSILADRAARLEAGLTEKQAPARATRIEPLPTETTTAEPLLAAALRND